MALFLDYDGTLREIERDPDAARPNAAVESLLARLRDRPGLDVTIISGRTPADLESFLGGYPFGLIAEHGASLRRPGRGHAGRQWERLDRNVGYAWKAAVMKLLRLYEGSTPGSFIEEKRTSLVWHYRRAEAAFGSWKAHALVEHLAALTANEPLQVRHGKKIVEVTASQVTKGAAVLGVLEGSPPAAGRDDGLVLVAGDDATDESMFRLDVPDLVSIKVGEGDTHARFRVDSPAAFRALLEEALAAG